MQVTKWLKFQPLLADVNTLYPRLQDGLLFTIQALCAAGARKVVSRTENFQALIQGTYSRHSRHFLYTLTCFEAGNGRDTVR